MQTRREYAASLGLAKVGVRGKLSRDAHAAIAAARTKGMKFSDDAPVTTAVKADKPKPAIRVVGDSTPKAAMPDYDSSAVRGWARRNGLKVGERGRLHPDIVKAYFDANPDERHSETVDKRPVAPTVRVAPKPVTRAETTAYVTVSGPHAWNVPKVVGFSRCASCSNAVSRCTHTMPVAPSYLASKGTRVSAVSLSKPVI